MGKLAVFLRGVNVNGISIKMDELKDIMEAMLYTEVKTVLATGNVIVSTMEEHTSFDNHKSKIEYGISTYFNYDCNVVLKTSMDIHNILNEASGHRVPEAYHHYILLSYDHLLEDKLSGLFATCRKEEQEQFIVGNYGMYWIVPKGNTLKSDFGNKVLGRKEFKNLITSRTINTLQKMSKYL